MENKIVICIDAELLKEKEEKLKILEEEICKKQDEYKELAKEILVMREVIELKEKLDNLADKKIIEEVIENPVVEEVQQEELVQEMEIPVEEPVVEELPVIEEAPIVEEAPVVEEVIQEPEVEIQQPEMVEEIIQEQEILQDVPEEMFKVVEDEEVEDHIEIDTGALIAQLDSRIREIRDLMYNGKASSEEICEMHEKEDLLKTLI